MIGVSGADKLEKQLSDFSLVFKRKLENMVENFAVEIAEKASQETPIGNQADIDKGSGRYWSFYKERLKLGLPMEVGYHKGAWDFSTTSNFPFIKRIRSVVEMLNDVRGESESVVLGKDFYIGATGPGFYGLEHTGLSAQAPNGIMKPTLNLILQVQKSDLQRFYEQG